MRPLQNVQKKYLFSSLGIMRTDLGKEVMFPSKSNKKSHLSVLENMKSQSTHSVWHEFVSKSM